MLIRFFFSQYIRYLLLFTLISYIQAYSDQISKSSQLPNQAQTDYSICLFHSHKYHSGRFRKHPQILPRSPHGLPLPSQGGGVWSKATKAELRLPSKMTYHKHLLQVDRWHLASIALRPQTCPRYPVVASSLLLLSLLDNAYV